MALSTLSLSTSNGVQGFPFQATINGLTTGNVEVLNDGSPGFSTANGKLMSQGLPYAVNTVVLREWEPGVGAGFRDTRIDINAVSAVAQRQKAHALIRAGRTLVQSGVALNRASDGSISADVFATDDLGATRKLPTGDAARPARPVVVNPASDTTGWVAQSAGVLTAKTFPVAHPSGQTSGLSLKALSGDTFVAARTWTYPSGFKLSQAYLLGLWVYVDTAPGSIVLRFSSDNFVSKTKQFSWAYPGQLHPGWNLLTVNPAGTSATNPGGASWSVAGGFLDTDTINGMEVQLTTSGSADVEIYLGGLFYHAAKPTRGAVILGFDKYGEASIPQVALPIMTAAGIKGYWAGDANLIENAGNSLTYLRQVYDAGWDAITQGKNHPDYTQPASKAVLAADIDYARGVMRSLGFTRSLMHFSYPLSANDAETDAILASMARSGWAWQIHPNEFNTGPKLLGHGATNIGGKTLTAVKQMVDAAVYYGTTLSLFTHGVVAGGDGTTPPADPLYWYQNDFQALVDYLVAYREQGVLDIDNPTQWLAKRTLP